MSTGVYPPPLNGFRTTEEVLAMEPRDKRPEIRLSQLSHGAG